LDKPEAKRVPEGPTATGGVSGFISI